MTLHLTPAMLEASYELLRTTLPFRRWKLPHADEIEFHVRYLTHRGDCVDLGEVNLIRLSDKRHHTLPEVLITMAHEMCHVRQNIERPNDDAHHGAYFKKCAKQVCRHHGWDYKTFR